MRKRRIRIGSPQSRQDEADRDRRRNLTPARRRRPATPRRAVEDAVRLDARSKLRAPCDAANVGRDVRGQARRAEDTAG